MTFLRRTLPDYTPIIGCITIALLVLAVTFWGGYVVGTWQAAARSCVAQTVELLKSGEQAMWAQTRAVERFLCTEEHCE